METTSILNTFEEWYNRFKQAGRLEANGSGVVGDQWVTDVEFVNSVSDQVDGYMVAPTGVYCSEPVEAKSLKVSTIDEFKEHLSNKVGKIFLHDVMKYPEQICTVVIDPKTYEPVILDEPIMQSGFYIVRFAEV